MTGLPSNEPRSPRLRIPFWRKIKGAFTSRFLPPINCKAIRELLVTPSLSSPVKDGPRISPISPVFSDTPNTPPTDGPGGTKSPPVERAWYTDASLSSPVPPFLRQERTVRENTSSSPHSSLETIRAAEPHPTSTLRAISTPYLFSFPSTEPVSRRTWSTGWIWEHVAEAGKQIGRAHV